MNTSTDEDSVLPSLPVLAIPQIQVTTRPNSSSTATGGPSSRSSYPPAKRTKRSVKPLPPALESIGPRDLSKVHCAVEVYMKAGETVEHSLAQFVETDVVLDGVVRSVRVDLNRDLNLCQLRRFCRQLGVKQTATQSKDGCRRAIAMLLEFENNLANNGLAPMQSEAISRNTLLRAINVVFSASFVDRFLKLNDAKNRYVAFVLWFSSAMVVEHF